MAKKKSRTYKIPPDVWPDFEKMAEQLAKKVAGGHKGDVVALAMIYFQQMPPIKRLELLKAFRDRNIPPEDLASDLDDLDDEDESGRASG